MEVIIINLKFSPFTPHSLSLSLTLKPTFTNNIHQIDMWKIFLVTLVLLIVSVQQSQAFLSKDALAGVSTKEPASVSTSSPDWTRESGDAATTTTTPSSSTPNNNSSTPGNSNNKTTGGKNDGGMTTSDGSVNFKNSAIGRSFIFSQVLLLSVLGGFVYML